MKSLARFAAPVAFAVMLAAAPVAHADPVSAREGQMVYGANGQRIGAVYHVSKDGSVQVILDGNLVTIPVDQLAVANGKLSSSKNKADLLR